MPITAELIKQLAKRNESESLDVKGTQYPFKNAADDDKAEILKDILAFANGFASEDAYILLGVREVKPPPHDIVGISDNINEASMRQFVNAKVLRCPKFSYDEVGVDGVTVGVICIPRQSGPFTLKRNFGGLKQSEVPLRRGTATDYPSHDQYQQLVLEHDRATFTDPAAQQVNASVEKALQSRPCTPGDCRCRRRWSEIRTL